VRFVATPLEGVFVVELERHADERGFFARAFCSDEFAAHGLVSTFEQANLSYNELAGTTRGLHYQAESAPEAKFFRCIAGETFNVAVDMRPESPTHGRWFGTTLSSSNRHALYIPPVCAAGYQALSDGAELLYLASAPYTPEAERGLRVDDPRLAIDWLLPHTVQSEKDRSWPLLDGD
jgi:dTDP-4-dehydrorhamnose 3,5-epimerase